MGHREKFIIIVGLAFTPAVFLAADAATQDAAIQPYGLPVPLGVDPESVCGDADELQDVERYDGNLGVNKLYVSENLVSTVQLQWRTERAIRAGLPGYSPGTIGGKRWCTGTLISQRTILTAGHCLAPQDGSSGWTTPFTRSDDGSVVFASPDQLAKLQVVHFGYQLDAATGIPRLPRTFAIERLVEHVFDPDGIDYAIIDLAPDPDGKLPGDFATPARLASHTVMPGETLALIQHPQGEPKKIEAGTASSVQASFIFYDDIDTWGASSGAGLRDRNGDIVGVHIRGGCETSANSAVSVVAIREVSDAL